MLGRTDSRTRLLILLVVFIVASVALVGRLAYWQVVQHDVLATKAIAQTTVRLEEPSRRGEIYDRSGTVVLATTVGRDRLVAATDKLTTQQRRDTGRRPDPDPGPRSGGGGGAARQARERQGLHHPGARDRADGRRPDPGRQRGAADHRHHPGTGAAPGLPAGRRQPGLVARRPPHGLRQPRGDGPVRHRAGVPGRPRRDAPRRRRRTRRERPDAARPGDRRGSRRARSGPPPDHRRGPPAGRRAGAARRLGRRQGEERVGRRDGPVHR